VPTKRIYDAYGGVVSVVEHDDLHKTTTFAQFQDFTPYFEANKRQQNRDDGYSPSREFRRVASIPNVMLLKMLREDGISPLAYFRKPKAYSKWLRRKVYDPDYRHLLTAPHKAH
jgi:hypothetical protein